MCVFFCKAEDGRRGAHDRLEFRRVLFRSNGTTRATHTARRDLYERAGATTVGLARRFYDEDDASALPRAIASREAFENAIALDIAMGGSTNTVLHLLAAAQARKSAV